jgi:para-nitrobenzyl esterase
MNIISRRGFLARASSAAIVLACTRFSSAQTNGDMVVNTPSGKLRGVHANGLRVFRGVPYAQPPVGGLRFRPPVKIQPWTEVRDATQYAPAAEQGGDEKRPISEDCLYLNIWAPKAAGPFPVYVWIHGGGLTGGSASEPMFSGATFAYHNIVQVNIAYRLGALGFLDVSPMLGKQYEGSANNGLADLAMALQWIQENIAAFGGDPSRVTIGGESAGAKLVCTLMGTPTAQPFFQQVISESGGAERVATASEAVAVGNGFAEDWRQIHGGAGADIRTAPAGEIIRAQELFLSHWPLHFPFRPEIDAATLPQAPLQAIAAGSAKNKRLLIGTNREESALFIGAHPANDPTAKDVATMPLKAFLHIYARYKELYPDMTDEQRRIRALSAEEYWAPSIAVTDEHVRAGGSAWVYMLTFAESDGKFKGNAFHSLDLRLIFERPNAKVPNTSEEAALGKQMHAAWIAFIRGQTPAATGLPTWPAYNLQDRPTMILDSQSQVVQKPYQAELDLWRSPRQIADP